MDILGLAFIETDGNIFIYKDGGFDGGLWNSVNQGWDGISVTNLALEVLKKYIIRLKLIKRINNIIL